MLWFITWAACIWTLEPALIGIDIINTDIGNFFVIGSLIGQLLFLSIMMKINEARDRKAREKQRESVLAAILHW